MPIHLDLKQTKKSEKRCHLFHFGGSRTDVLCRKLAADRTFELAGREQAKLWMTLDTILGLHLGGSSGSINA